MSHVYGCHNRPPFKDHVEISPDAWDDDGATRTSRLKTIPFTMSRDCNYTHTELGQKDPGCQGCSWRANPPRERPVPAVPATNQGAL